MNHLCLSGTCKSIVTFCDPLLWAGWVHKAVLSLNPQWTLFRGYLNMPYKTKKETFSLASEETLLATLFKGFLYYFRNIILEELWEHPTSTESILITYYYQSSSTSTADCRYFVPLPQIFLKKKNLSYLRKKTNFFIWNKSTVACEMWFCTWLVSTLPHWV